MPRYAAAAAPALASGFTIIEGAEFIREYESSPGKRRAFCGHCGSPLYSRREAHPDLLRLRLGVLNSPPATLKIQAHIFTDGEPAWSPADGAPRCAGEEPSRAG